MKEFKKILFPVDLSESSEKILPYIESQGIDLIITGTHGRKGLDKVMFGSVAEFITLNMLFFRAD